MSKDKYNDEDDFPRWDGQRGLPFERAKRSLRPILMGIYASATDDYHLWQAATGQCMGGDAPGAPALPVGAGLLGAQGKRNKRQVLLFTKLANKFIDDEKMRNMLLNLPEGDVAVVGGGFQGIGRRAWLLLVSQGEAPIDDEYITRILTIFATCTILETVGYKVGSVASFHRHLTNLVHLVPAAHLPTDDRYAIKLLECLSKESPDSLALESAKELKAVPAEQRFVLVGGGRDLTALVTYFAEMWDYLVRNKKIAERAVASRVPSSSVLIAGELEPQEAEMEEETLECQQAMEEMALEATESIDNDDGYAIDEWNALVMRGDYRGRFGGRGGRGRGGGPFSGFGQPGRGRGGIGKRMLICHNCKGAGHPARLCPSPPDPERSVSKVRMQLGLIEDKTNAMGSSEHRQSTMPNPLLMDRSEEADAARSEQPRRATRPPSPNGPRARPRIGQPRPPYGSTPANAYLRVRTPRANVTTTEDDQPDEDVLGTDFDVLMCVIETRSRSQAASQQPSLEHNDVPHEHAERDDVSHGISLSAAHADGGMAAEPLLPLPAPIVPKAVKMLLFSVNDYNETAIYVHQRQQPRGGNLDINGVMLLPEETLLGAVVRCVEQEFDGHPTVRDAAMASLESHPDGHVTFDMRIHGFVNSITIVAVQMRPLASGRLEGTAGDSWKAARTVVSSSRWLPADAAYTAMIVDTMSLARGVRDALVAVGCEGSAVPKSPRGYFSEANPSAGDDAGKFTVLMASAGTIRLRGSGDAAIDLADLESEVSLGPNDFFLPNGMRCIQFMAGSQQPRDRIIPSGRKQVAKQGDILIEESLQARDIIATRLNYGKRQVWQWLAYPSGLDVTIIMIDGKVIGAAAGYYWQDKDVYLTHVTCSLKQYSTGGIMRQQQIEQLKQRAPSNAYYTRIVSLSSTTPYEHDSQNRSAASFQLHIMRKLGYYHISGGDGAYPWRFDDGVPRPRWSHHVIEVLKELDQAHPALYLAHIASNQEVEALMFGHVSDPLRYEEILLAQARMARELARLANRNSIRLRGDGPCDDQPLTLIDLPNDMLSIVIGFLQVRSCLALRCVSVELSKNQTLLERELSAASDHRKMKALWLTAMQSELQSLRTNQAWTSVTSTCRAISDLRSNVVCLEVGMPYRGVLYMMHDVQAERHHMMRHLGIMRKMVAERLFCDALACSSSTPWNEPCDVLRIRERQAIQLGLFIDVTASHPSSRRIARKHTAVFEAVDAKIGTMVRMRLALRVIARALKRRPALQRDDVIALYSMPVPHPLPWYMPINAPYSALRAMNMSLFRRFKPAATRIQAQWRSYRERHLFYAKVSGAVIIQMQWRALREKILAATAIQIYWRSYCDARVASDVRVNCGTRKTSPCAQGSVVPSTSFTIRYDSWEPPATILQTDFEHEVATFHDATEYAAKVSQRMAELVMIADPDAKRTMIAQERARLRIERDMVDSACEEDETSARVQACALKYSSTSPFMSLRVLAHARAEVRANKATRKAQFSDSLGDDMPATVVKICKSLKSLGDDMPATVVQTCKFANSLGDDMPVPVVNANFSLMSIASLPPIPPPPPKEAGVYVFTVERTGGIEEQVALSAAGDRQWMRGYHERQALAGTWREWIVDCGATKHVVNNVNELDHVWPVDGGDAPRVRVGNGQRLSITHVGQVTLQVKCSNKDGALAEMKLSNVLVVPEMGPRLYSCGSGFTEDGIETHLNGQCWLRLPDQDSYVRFNDNPVHYSFLGRSSDRAAQVHEAVVLSATTLDILTSEAERLHQRLGHFSLNRIISAKGRSTGLDLEDLHHHRLNCEPCLLNSKRAAMSRLSKTQLGQQRRFTYFGECVASDLVKMLESMPHEFLYGMIFNDRASNLLDIRFTKSKEPDGVLSGLESWTREFSKELDANGGLKEWHTDNGGEFQSKDIHEFCHELSARHTRTVPETPQDNPGAERGNGVLVRQTRILLAASNLSDRLWPFAFKYVCFVHNSLPSRAHSPPISPYEFVYGKLPNLDLIHSFGCKCYVPLSESEQEANVKTAPTSVVATHLGFDRSTGGHHVYVPELRQFTVAHGVRFIDDEYFAPPELARNETYLKKPRKAKEKDAEDNEVAGGTRTVARGEVPRQAEEGDEQGYFAQGLCDEPVALSLARLPNADLPSWCLKPETYEQAVHPDNPLGPMWKEAMDTELTGKMENGKDGFARPVPLAEALRNRRRPLQVKWVYSIKYNIDGSIKTLKARLVGKGFVQRKGLDYEQTFASTIRAATVRAFFAIVAKYDMELALADVVKAFTQAEVDRLMYIEMPRGYEQSGYCLLLNQSLEGMKQAAYLWQKLLSDVLTAKLHFTRSLIDPCLYSKTFGNTDRIILIVWVDDIAIGYTRQQDLDNTITELKKHINLTFEGEMKRFLGMEITRDRKARTLTITQTTYISKLFEQHMSSENSKSWKHITPSGTSKEDAMRFMAIEPTTNEVEREINIKRGYLVLIGATMYAMVFTRPDVAFHISVLAKCMQSPSTSAYEALLNVIRYLYHTRHIGISFGPIDPTRLKHDGVEFSDPRVWHDASFGGRDFQPYGGGYVEYYHGPVTWIARKLKFVPLSTCEAEVGAMVGLAKEVLFIRGVLTDMIATSVQSPTIMVTDSKSGNDTVMNAGATKHTVHFERWLHFARRLQLMNTIKSVLVTTDLMRADDKTKVVDKKKFMMCRRETMNLPANVTD